MNILIKYTLIGFFTISSPIFAQTVQDNDADKLVILITGLRPQISQNVPTSATVVTEQTLKQQGVDHVESLISTLPNTLFSGETSRPRYIQVRGIGERSEYTGAPNASVGLNIDGIDFSGIGGIASLLDVKQVEVFRGPQGTRYGANALAGLISIQSNDPTPVPEYNIGLSLGSDNLQQLTAVANGPLSKKNNINYRVALSQHSQDGFRDNAFLQRSDTNNRDETVVRAKFNWESNDGTDINFTYLYADFDNGYDAFALDNSFRTLTNQPGEDDQNTQAGVLEIKHKFDSFTFISSTSTADSDILYSYDQDWVFPGFWEVDPNFNHFFSNEKNRKTISQEFRFLSSPSSQLFNGKSDWVAGFYALNLDETNFTNDTFSSPLSSDYNALSTAIFGQLESKLSPKLNLTTGLRFEQRTVDYDDSNLQSFSPDDHFVGGKIALSYKLSDQHLVYGAISKGYKAGGFNPVAGDNFPENRRFYEPETLINFEVGSHYKNIEHQFNSNVSLFYMQRKDLQVDGSEQLPSGAFAFFIENIDRGNNYGIEWEYDWQFNESWRFDGSLGLLQTDFENYAFTPSFQAPLDLSGRDQAHAPNYQFQLGLEYTVPSGIYTRFELTGVDGFFFSNSHNEQSSAYETVNARIGYRQPNWSATLWGKNILDQEYATRGFFFANDPEFLHAQKFVRLGDRRQFGVTVSYNY